MLNRTNIIDAVLQSFIRDFPFFSDPIFLFNPSRIPSKEELLSNNLGDVRYPLVDQMQERLPDIYLRFHNIRKVFQETSFEDSTIENEYLYRLQSLEKIIRLIEIFYSPDETEKFNIVTEYFGIDIDICGEIADTGIQYIQDQFVSKSSLIYLSEGYKIVLSTIIQADEIKEYFEMAISFLGLEKNWIVEVSDNILAIVHGDFESDGGKVYIPANYTCSYQGLLALIIHEIDGHCRQFTYSGWYGLYGPGIRSAHSEEILEGLAIYLEHSWNAVIFGENSIEKSLHNFSLKYSLLSKKITIQEFFKKSKVHNYFRTFRGFYDVAHFMNTKDFVYMQGLYKIISLKSEFGFCLFDMLYSEGVINGKYIKKNIHKYSTPQYKSVEDLLMNSSAFFILNQILHDKK